MRPTLYEFAGGEQAFEPFAAALHARCLADPELNHPFSHADQNPEHVPRLAAYLAEALGGPPTYSAECADQAHVVWLHSGNGDMSDLGRRFADCFMLAADDAGWPQDPEFRAAIRGYIAWAVDEVALSHPDDTDIPPGLPLPRWSWDGLQRLCGYGFLPTPAVASPLAGPACPVGSHSDSGATPGPISSRPVKNRRISSWLRGRMNSAPDSL
jgi:hemoglobin